MVDLSDKVSESEVMNNSPPTTPERASSDGTHIKTCADCGTTKTPLWRGGPAGPKSLCNACGIRSRKKRRALLGLNKEDKKTKKSSSKISNNGGQQFQLQNNENNNNNNGSSSSGNNFSSSSGDSSNNSRSRFGDISLKKKLLTFGRDVALQRPRSTTSQRRKLGEEEQAAFLLMALSCGSVYA
ncbi:hypothetical protein M9H77_36887 [Catharanthus roseus]|uniref:Uncharacterized protein n=1 Tax=Catharanthus roseus TaxID=4058 RepID=A0ACB9ZXD0_CATRO|nr:hypothetical protein M9H77_36887 [Catharanthus roseus]